MNERSPLIISAYCVGNSGLQVREGESRQNLVVSLSRENKTTSQDYETTGWISQDRAPTRRELCME